MKRPRHVNDSCSTNATPVYMHNCGRLLTRDRQHRSACARKTDDDGGFRVARARDGERQRAMAATSHGAARPTHPSVMGLLITPDEQLHTPHAHTISHPMLRQAPFIVRARHERGSWSRQAMPINIEWHGTNSRHVRIACRL